jgi:Domain of unknown function (DUF4402)
MMKFGGLCARVALSAVGLLASGTVHAATQSGSVSVIALTPINILNVDPLDFGLIIPGAAAGTVSLDAQTGARTGTVVTLAGATFSRARFVGAGTPFRVVTLAFDPSPTITISNGATSCG